MRSFCSAKASLIFSTIISVQGLTNLLSGCPGQVKIFAGQVKKLLTCPEKCINYTGNTNDFQGFLAEAICQTSRSDFDLLGPVSVIC